MNPGSEVFRIDLSRENPGQSWGFRLQGGSNFSTPLSIQSVNPGSPAEGAGLKPGDMVLQINSKPSDELEHEQAKQEIVASGNQVFMVVQRGAVKIWKPKVTPINDIRPKELRTLPDGLPPEETYVQKTSLAADKQEVIHIGSAHNRTARGFIAGSGDGAPTAAKYNNPISLYSKESAQDSCQVATSGMQSLRVTDTVPNRSPSPFLLSAVRGEDPLTKRSASPAALAVTDEDLSRLRSSSPTLRAIHDQDTHDAGGKSAIFKDHKDGEEIRYEGYVDPNKQSRSFRLLEHGLQAENAGEGPTTGDVKPPGIRSVKAPVFDPAQHQKMQAEHMTCKACGTLVIGVFVKIKGYPLHPECFKCHKCGKNLKNQGYIEVEGQLYCEPHAMEISQPADGKDVYAVPVYR